MKTVVMIDGPYLAANIRSLPNFRLDYAKLLLLLKARYSPLLRVLYYNARLPQNDPQERFFGILRDLGYEIHISDTNKTADILIAKGFDVSIAVDMLQWADSCDRIVLVSGDADFTPALLALPRKGVIAEILAFRAAASKPLLRSTTEFTDLMELIPDLALVSTARHKRSITDPSAGLKPVDPEEALINRAALAGIRLERALRKLCEARALSMRGEAGLDALNNRLAGSGVYDKLTQKRILVWSEIRNKAAHGLVPHYTPNEVQEMESWIDNFVRSNGA